VSRIAPTVGDSVSQGHEADRQLGATGKPPD
jgi:hypothetical protein